MGSENWKMRVACARHLDLCEGVQGGVNRRSAWGARNVNLMEVIVSGGCYGRVCADGCDK